MTIVEEIVTRVPGRETHRSDSSGVTLVHNG